MSAPGQRREEGWKGVLEGKWVLVSGGTSGIGAAVAEAMAREGAKLVLMSRKEEALQHEERELKSLGAPEVRHYAVDLTDGAAVDQLLKGLTAEVGGFDVLVNDAGMGVKGTPLEGQPDEWEKLIALNLMAPMRLTRHIAPGMVQKREGTIINIGSICGMDPSPGQGVYAASKWGLRGWSLSCREALKEHNIKVVYIAPAFVATPMTEDIDNTDPNKMMQPTDVAEAAMFAFRVTAGCCPETIVLRNVQNPKTA